MPTSATAEDVVLTGLSGRFPESDSIEEFERHLFEGVNLVTTDDRRWIPGLHGLPERSGKLKQLAHFDATFFGVHAKQAHLMDPQLRLLLEITHEAIVDAGLSPTELRGSRTGVFVGVSNSETEELWTSEPDRINGYALTGCCRAMFPNRVSFAFDLRGPSYAIDTACSSSMFAFAQAYSAIRDGHCDAAVVAGCNLCLKPATSLNFHRLGMLSPEGRCAAFDESGRGYVRSEAVVAVLLQRRGAARRIYATVRNARTNTDGAKVQGITFPSGDAQRLLAEETFAEACLHPTDVAYVEAHGTGTKVGDPQEVNAIAELFCKGRDKLLLLGSVKSNMGHSELASGLCSIAKVVLAMERGVIPANLHYKSPNLDIPALNDGRIQVVDKNTPWEGGLVAVNSFGFGGANAHVVLESERGARACVARYTVPRLVLASGRTEDAVREMLQHADAHAGDGELHALQDAVHAHNIPGHVHRGYALLAGTYTEEIFEVESSEPRPICFVFSGMGSQWAGMARSLMSLPVFATSVQRSAAVLVPYGVDLVHIVTEAPETAFDVVASCVSIAAVQVALVDVLREVGVRPDTIVGHSTGELGCAYADETLTGAQAVLAAYWCGRSIVDAAPAPGAIAAIGLSWEQCKASCPPDVTPACHNAADNVTVSGPVVSVERFVAELAAEGIFARRINSSGIAFHSKYIEAVAPLLRHSFERVISEPKPRSPRWISSSVPRDKWDSEIALLSDANYFVNNMVSPVRFAEALRLVPARSLVVEVAPHALLQTVLKRTLPGAAHVALVRRDATDTLTHLLAAVGRVYGSGAQPRIAALYPTVAWPVSRGTPGLAARVRWDHGTEWAVAQFGVSRSGDHVVEFELARAEDAYLAGHDIDGRVVFPATGYLTLVWHALSRLQARKPEECAVVLEDVQFRRATIVPRDAALRFLINLLEGSGEFEVCEGGAIVVTGRIRLAESSAAEQLHLPPELEPAPEPNLQPLDASDVYKELHLRGYNYSDPFRGIQDSDPLGTAGHLTWDGNWIPFMDTMVQFSIIGIDTRELHLPVRLQRVLIDPTAQPAPGTSVRVRVLRELNVIAAGGVELRGLETNPTPRINTQPSKLERYIFVPDDNLTSTGSDAACARWDALIVSLQLVLENVGTRSLKLCEVAFGREPEALLTPIVLAAIEAEPEVSADATLAVGTASSTYQALQECGVKVITRDVSVEPPDTECHVVLAVDVLTRHSSALPHLVGSLAPTGMLLLEEMPRTLDELQVRDSLTRAGLEIVTRQMAPSCEYVLLRRRPDLPPAFIVIDVTDDTHDWMEPLRVALMRAVSEDIRVYAVTRATDCGVLGLVMTLRAEPCGHALRIYHLPDARERFNPAAPAHAARVALDLAVNVLRNGTWGSYRYLELPAEDAPLKVEHACVILETWELSSLHWIESNLQWQPTQPGTDLCYVHYASLNNRDVMLVTDNLAGQECVLGQEFSGRTSTGKRVMGIVAGRAMATTVLADEGFLWKVPTTWSLEEAATVPVAYATAYYALVVRGCMTTGESVLVHAGSGSVGQAAIAIALHASCIVYTTVETSDEREFLRARFPQLPAENVANSSDTSFEQHVLHRTGGRGVDLVLNSLTAEKLQASVRCLSMGGRFLEIGKLDLASNTALGMAVFLKNTTFHGIVLDALFDVADDYPEKAAVVRCVSEGIASGVVQPLPATVYSYQQLEQAFRSMATGNPIGKVLVHVRAEEAPAPLVLATPRTYMRAGCSYVLVDGLGGGGLELAQWLVSRGITRLVLTSCTGATSGYQAWCVRRWRARGVHVVTVAADDARALLQAATELGPIAGIFNMSTDNQMTQDFQLVAKPKIDATQMLEASRELAPEFDYFVFSSVSHKNLDQKNGLANSGRKSVVVQWGAIGDMGNAMPQRVASNFQLGILKARPQAAAAIMVLAKTPPRHDLVQAIAKMLVSYS